MIYIKVHKGNVEKAISKLKKQVKETKLMLELREYEFYTKPSALKREKRAKARLRQKKQSRHGVCHDWFPIKNSNGHFPTRPEQAKKESPR